MVQQTPRFNINDYEVGEDPPWDHSDLVNAFDEYAIQRDTLANRPASGDYPDELFYATDSDELYRWDSSSGSWNLLSGSSGEGWENVKDYGAVGDNSNDDTQAIQDALDAGDNVFFPPGRYKITSGLNGDGCARIVGCGGSYTRINHVGTTAGQDALNVTPNSRANSFYMSGLLFENAPQDGFRLDNVHQWQIEFCRAIDCGRHGIHHSGSWKGSMVACSTANNTDTGIRAGSGGHAVSYFGCHALSNETGIFPSSNCGLFGCVVESNRTDVHVTGDGVGMYATYHEGENEVWDPNNPHYGVLVENASGVTIQSGQPVAGGGIGIEIVNSDVSLVNAGTTNPVTSDGKDFQWASDDNLGWRADTDSTVTVVGLPQAPYKIDDINTLQSMQNSQIRPPDDLYGGNGDFSTDSDSDGLADGWTAKTGNETFTLSNDSIYPSGANRQQMDTTAEFDGIYHDVTLEANTTYTFGAFLDMDVAVFLNDGNGRLPGFDWQPIPQGSRFCYATWTTGSNPGSNLGLTARGAGTVYLDATKVVKGDYDYRDFPFLQ